MLRAIFSSSGCPSGLKIQIHADLDRSLATMVYSDFDDSKFVSMDRDSTFKLKPVIKASFEQTQANHFKEKLLGIC